MSDRPVSPRIEKLAWGRLETDRGGTFKDAKLWPGGGRAWDWDETGTRHSPGIQAADVRELLEHEPRAVILSKGQWQRLGVTDEAIRLLEDRGVETQILETRRAAEKYNELAAAGTPVAGLFHTTC